MTILTWNVALRVILLSHLIFNVNCSPVKGNDDDESLRANIPDLLDMNDAKVVVIPENAKPNDKIPNAQDTPTHVEYTS